LKWSLGSPKEYQGAADEWKNWIDWNSKFKAQTDELNRDRHFFFTADDKGRLWRKELHELDKHQGEVKDGKFLDYFYSRVQRNTTGLHTDWPYVSFRLHEHYFVRSSSEHSGAPVAFNDLQDGMLTFTCPQGEVAKSLTTIFDPQKLRVCPEMMMLFHPVTTKAKVLLEASKQTATTATTAAAADNGNGRTSEDDQQEKEW
jgi:hypothetical protein